MKNITQPGHVQIPVFGLNTNPDGHVIALKAPATQ